jgi:hypothetical protein
MLYKSDYGNMANTLMLCCVSEASIFVPVDFLFQTVKTKSFEIFLVVKFEKRIIICLILDGVPTVKQKYFKNSFKKVCFQIFVYS